jgi:ATP-dependent metalloprotease
MFENAKKNAPCIIFIDEIDALGGSRRLKEQQALRMTLNQLLVEMDGFNPNDDIVVIGATNFPETLDPALVRPGRFDRHVVVPLPDIEGRKEILDLYIQKIHPLSADVDTRLIARSTPGCSGADLFNILNIAAVEAAKENAESVTLHHIEMAKDRVFMGAERKSQILSEPQRRAVAYHEGGHALVALKTQGATPIHKATIVPRGQALGMVAQVPEDDQPTRTYEQLLAELDVCMGGRAAEELVFGHVNVSTGATSDFAQATSIAGRMVRAFGMSPLLGTVDTYSVEHGWLSEETQHKIDQEIQRLLSEAQTRARELLRSNRAELDKLAEALLDRETLSLSQIQETLNK